MKSLKNSLFAKFKKSEISNYGTVTGGTTFSHAKPSHSTHSGEWDCIDDDGKTTWSGNDTYYDSSSHWGEDSSSTND